jgi:hypothetical protein
MWPALNLVGHLTSLSGLARVRNPLLSVGVTSLVRTRGGRLGVLSRICLRSSMTLWRSFRLRTYSCALQFYVMWRCASRSDTCRLGLAEDAASLRARPAQSLRPTDGSPQGTPTDFSAIVWFAASAPCWVRNARGEPSGVICWMVSIITCTRTALKSRFRF